jgi:general secretion pathway protein H
MKQPTRYLVNGFTLIEVLVVILIMGIVISMATLSNTSSDPLKDTVDKSEGFKYWFGKITDHSLLSGDDIGLYFTESSIIALTWREGDLLEAEDEIVWEPYSDIETFIVPETLKFEFFLDVELSEWVELEREPPEEGMVIIPHVVITPSEEYFPSFFINFYDPEYSDEQVKI